MEEIGKHLKGFVSSKASRTAQKVKESLHIASKQQDNKEYMMLLKAYKKNMKSGSSDRPESCLLKYMREVRIHAMVYRSLCQALRDVLAVHSVTGQEPGMMRVNAVEDDLHAIQTDFISILDELATWIRNHQIESEREALDVKRHVKLCEQRRLDLEVVRKTYPANHSVQELTQQLYKEAKYNASDDLFEAIQTNKEAFLDVLLALQPKESEFEALTADRHANLMLVFQQLMSESPIFVTACEFEIRDVRRSWNKLCKELKRYTKSMQDLSSAKYKLHKTIIDVIEDKQDGRLRWFPESKQAMVKIPVYQLKKVSSLLSKMKEKLEVAQVLQDMARSTRDPQDSKIPMAQLDGVQRELPRCFESCLVNVRKIEEEFRHRSEELASKVERELEDYSISCP